MNLEETLKKASIETEGPAARSLTVFLESRSYVLTGDWNWDLQTDAVYCTDVIYFPEGFEGARCLLHPDDRAQIVQALDTLRENRLQSLSFRVITTYGEVKMLSGQDISLGAETLFSPPSVAEGGFQEALERSLRHKESAALSLRRELTDFAEKLHGWGSWYIAKNTGEAWYSDNVFRIHGLPPQSLNAHPHTFNIFIHPAQRTTVVDTLEQAYAGEVPVHLEYGIVQPGGTQRQVELVTQWSYFQGEKIFSGILRDITPSRESEDQLSASNRAVRLHQHLLQFSEQQGGSAFWYTNLVTRKTNFSANYYRIYGVKSGMLPETNAFLNFVHPEDRKMVNAAISKMYQEHSLPDLEFRIIRPDGKMRYLRQTARLLAVDDELTMAGFVQDLSVQRGLEKKIGELTETGELNQIIADTLESDLQAGYILFHPEGTMRWSDGLYQLLGYKPGAVEPLLRLLVRSIHPDDVKLFSDAVTLMLNNQAHGDVVFRTVGRAGNRELSVSFRHFEEQGWGIGVVRDLSRHRQLEQKAAELAGSLDLLRDQISELMLLTNEDNTVIAWNARLEEKTGIREKDAVYQNLFDVLPRLNQPSYVSALNRALNGETVVEEHRTEEYLDSPHDFVLLPWQDEDGKIKGVLHLVRDITLQLDLQQRLSERLNFIESLVESSVDRIVVLDSNMNYLYWNRKAEEYYSISKEAVLGRNILEVFPGFRNDPNYQQFRSVLRGETVHIPANLSAESDEYSETWLTPIKNEAGAITAVLWVVHDLRKDFTLMQQLRKSDEILNHINEAYMELDQDLRFRYVNAHCEEIWGRKRELLIGRRMTDTFPMSAGSAPLDAIRRTLETGEPSKGEYFSPVVRRWIFMSCQPHEDGVIVLFYDIHDLRETQQRLDEEHRRLKEAQKVGRIGSFERSLPGTEVEWSEELYRLHGLDPETRITLDLFLSFVPEEERQELRGAMKKLESGGAPLEMTHRIIRPDGTVLHVHRRAELQRDAEGNAVKVHGTIQDVTELKLAQQKLEEGEALLRSAEAAVGAGSYEADLVSQSLRFSDGMYRIFGEEPQSFIPTSEFIDSRTFPADVGPVRKILDEAISQGKSYYYRRRIYHSDGSLRTVESHGKTVCNKSGEVVKLLGQVQDITERQRNESELEKNIAVLQHAEEMAQIGSWEYDIAGGEFSWSAGMYRLFGLKEGSPVHPEVYLDFAIEEDRSMAERIVESLTRDPKAFEEMMRIRRGQEERLLRIKASVVCDEQGEPRRLVGVDLDVTDLRAAEEKLRAGEDLLRQTTLATPDAITLFDLEGKEPVYLNDCLAQWTGLSIPDLMNMGTERRLQLIHPEDQAILLNFQKEMLEAAAGEVRTAEYRLRGVEGWMWIRNRSKVFQRNALGQVTHILSLLQDITEEVRLKQELMERTRYAESLIDASIDRIAVFDRNQRFVGWNRRCTEINGLAREEVLGKTISEVFPYVGQDPEFVKAQERALAGEYVHIPSKKDVYTNRMLELFYVPLRDGEGRTYAVLNILHDITDRVRAEDELNTLNRTLESKNRQLELKNDEITQFAFVASHDLKEPVRKIQTFSDWLLQHDEAQLGGKARNFVHKIHDSVIRMSALIEDILVLTRIHSETGRPEAIDLLTLVEKVKRELHETIAAGGAVVEIESLPLLHGYYNQVAILIRNLLGNALKFQAPGAKPQIRIWAEFADGSEAQASGKEEYLKLCIEDNGIGFDRLYARKIFQVFQRLHGKHEYEGTGMGLAICKKIMENHEGWISAESDPGQGSRFCCYFPIR